MYEFVVVAGYVDGGRHVASLAADLDDYGAEGYLVVEMNTVIYDGRPYAVIVMERHLDDAPPDGGRELSVLDGGAS